MNKIWAAVLIFVFIPAFNSQVSAEIKILDIELPETEISTSTLVSEDVVIYTGEKLERPKLSIALGLGNGYKLGDQKDGRYHYDNSSVISLQFGYLPSKYLEVQGEYSRVGNFYRKRSWGEQNQRFNSYGLNLKLKRPLMFDSIKLFPYIVVGMGKNRMTYCGIDTGKNFSYSGFGNYRKIGVGAEVDLNRDFFLFSEYNYYKMGLITFRLKSGKEVKNFPYYSVVFSGIGIKF